MITFKNMHNVLNWLAVTALTIFLMACGGGTGSSDSGAQPSGGTTNIAPVANISASLTTPVVGQSVSFSPGASFDLDGSIASYQWDFGDGEKKLVSTNALVNHVYSSIGTYIVTLSVFDNDGKTNSVSLPIQVGLVPNIAPIASYFVSSTTAIVGEALNFNPAASNDIDGSILDYAWDFGDGVYYNNRTNVALSHSFSAVGNFMVKLTVTDNRGGTHTVSKTIVVTVAPNIAPVASFISSNSVAIVGQSLSFDPIGSADSDGTIVSYFWNFGDGSVRTTLTNALVTYSFAQVGNYKVDLTVTDNRGGSHSFSNFIYVSRALNDTGQYSCYDALGTILASCVGTGADGEFGLDSNTATNANNNGSLGFNFTKLDTAGNALPSNATSWDCVLDNVTGLTWENKNILNSDVRSEAHLYTWYSSDSTSNGGHVGATGTNTCNATLIGNLCNSQAYVNRVNAVGLCGKMDWRVSSVTELMTLVHWGKTSTPRIDLAYFPNQQADIYWTGTTDPFNVLNAYLFSFATGSLSTSAKSMTARVQLVRGTP